MALANNDAFVLVMSFSVKSSFNHPCSLAFSSSSHALFGSSSFLVVSPDLIGVYSSFCGSVFTVVGPSSSFRLLFWA